MKLALSGKRVIGYGENLIPMGGTVIDTDTNKVYQNATIAECDGCPSDIDLVGYEYHAGNFVPCAPYGTEDSGGEIMVACDNCATPRKSGIDIQDVHDADKLSRGTLSSDRLPTVPVAKGGTGLSTLTADSFIAGNGTGAVKLLTPKEVLTEIGAAPTGYGLGGNATYISDLNNAIKNGFYCWGNDATNAPFTAAHGGGSMIVISRDTNYQIQIAGDNTSRKGDLAVRKRVNGTWTDWYTVYNDSGQITLPYLNSDYPVMSQMSDGTIIRVLKSYNDSILIFGHYEDGKTTLLDGNDLWLRAYKHVKITPYYIDSSFCDIYIGAQSSDRGVEIRPSVDGGGSLGAPSGTLSGRWKYVYSINGVSTSSDERLKENVSDDFTKLAEAFFKLRPVTFEYADIKDGKTRIGFIAQELEKAFREVGLDPDKFALLQKDELDPEGDMAEFIGDTTVYSLSYSEFIALNTAMIQKQQAEIKDLKSEITKIKEHLGIS